MCRYFVVDAAGFVAVVECGRIRAHYLLTMRAFEELRLTNN